MHVMFTQPRKPLHHGRRYGVLGQKRCDQVDDEEEQPTGNKTTDDDRQGLGGFVLALQRNPTIVTPS